MKESKKFFDNNRLNKGYRNKRSKDAADSDLLKQQLHSLPPLDIMEEYEAQYPGTFKKLMDMTQKEQDNRHKLQALEIEKNAKCNRWGKVCAMFCVMIIAILILALVSMNSHKIAALVTVFTFISVYFINKNTDFKHERPRNRNHHRNNRNNRYQK